MPSAIQIASSASRPVWIRDVDSARQPFQTAAAITVPAGQLLGNGQLTTVPKGQRLVIEYVSAWISLPAGQRIVQLVMQSPVGTVSHYFTPTLLATNGPVDLFSVSQPLRLYANPEQQVLGALSRTGTAGSATMYLSVSGYMVDVP